MGLSIKITNIVAKSKIIPPFSLSGLEAKHAFDHTNIYNPKVVFHGARIFIPYKHVKISVFRTGSILFRAARSSRELDESLRWLSAFLSNYNLKLSDTYEILNIVAISRLPFSLNLFALATYIPNCSYDPSSSLSEDGHEHFVNCITFYFREERPRYTALIFPTGNVTLAGFKSVSELEDHTAKLFSMISEISSNHPEVLAI